MPRPACLIDGVARGFAPITADTTNRLARIALPGSISFEWNQLGITELQAHEMIDRAIGYIAQTQAFDRDYAAAMHENEIFDLELHTEKQIAALQSMTWEEIEASRDPGQDYAEAYADVAGDPTLSWRLEHESPIDILADVRGEALGYDPDDASERAGHDDIPTPTAAEVIALMSRHAVEQGRPVASREQDNDRDVGIGR